jgi:hypothetical protein
MSKPIQPEQKDAAPTSTEIIPARSGAFRISVFIFLIALVLMFVAAPFLEMFKDGDLVATILFTLVLLSAVLAIGGRRRTLVLAIVLVIPAIACKWINHSRPDLIFSEISICAGLLFVLFIVFHLMRFMLRAPHVDSEILCAGIATYLMLGLLWALIYMLVDRLIPNSFIFNGGGDSGRPMRGFSSIYFSLVTLSTVGFGDMVPASGVARMFAMAEATVGLFYVTILISRLVALYSSKNVIEEVKEMEKSVKDSIEKQTDIQNDLVK